MDYFLTLRPEQKANIHIIIDRMSHRGITNLYAMAAVLAVVSKESGFVPHSESSYAHTSNARIRKVFTKRVAGYSEEALTALKSNDVNFFNAVYGLAKFGQTSAEGYKFRGRGFNQITFKENYKRLGTKIKVDLVANPDRLNEPAIAADCLLQYFIDGFATAPKDDLALYNCTGINDFKNYVDSVHAVYHANAGWGHSKAELDADPTGGRKLAESRVKGFLDMILEMNNNKIV